MTSREDVRLLDKQKIVAIPFMIPLIVKYGETIHWCESSI